MNLGYAVAVFHNIDSDKYTDNEKAIAIYMVMNMETHNSITKSDMLNVLKWLWHQFYIWEEEEAGEQE